MAWPIFRPPPAYRIDMAPGQWSRPASLLIFGVRPNSPNAITSTSSCRPRSYRSVTRAATAWSNFGSSLVLSSLEVVGVRVPAAAGLDGHEGDARLDQPARQQAALAQVVAAVALAQPIRLLAARRTPAAPWCSSPSPGRRGRRCPARRCRRAVSMSRRMRVEVLQQLLAAARAATRSTRPGSFRLRTWKLSELGSLSGAKGLYEAPR